MKKAIIALSILFTSLVASVNVNAQDSTTSIGHDLGSAFKKTGKAISKGAKKVGNKTAELASKGKSDVVDKKYAGKQGPNGETIFIDKQSKYYSVDSKGHKVYFTESQLKNKN